MAVLKAPLLSLGASQQLGKALVFFAWKGLNCVRTYVVPSNPKTTPQTTQRGYLTDAVTAIHDAQAFAVVPLVAIDITAYALLGSTHPTPRTWFNEVVKRWLDQKVASLFSAIFRDGIFTPGNGQVDARVRFTEDSDSANAITAGNWFYGTSKTALINSVAATVGGDQATDIITGLTNGTKYFFQFRPTAHADFVGVRSGIYYATPSA